MGHKYIVVIDPDILTGPVFAAQAQAGTALAVTGIDALGSRIQILEQLGDALLAPSASFTALGAHGAVAAMNAPASAGTMGLAPQRGNYQVLEALGAIIVDEDDVDVTTLRTLVGLEVIADQTIPAPDPVVSAGPANLLTPDWHLQKTRARSEPGTGADVLVGVLDTGIDAAHSEFVGKTIHFEEFDVVGRRLGTPPHDAGHHGTHVCGLVAGQSCGVAPNADLAVAAVLTTPQPGGRLGGSLVQIANGLNWLLTNQFRPGQPGVDLLNASLGGLGFNAYLQTALRNALMAPGVLMVAAIGNNARVPIHSNRHGSPGNYPDVLGVGATDDQDVVADFSDWGFVPPPVGAVTKPDLSAPGVDVRSCVPNGGFAYLSGTSMASPIVCGLGARKLSQNSALRGQPLALRAALQAHATVPVTPGPHGNLGGAGRILV